MWVNSKFGFCVIAVAAVIFIYLFLTILMPVYTTTTTIASNAMLTSPYASNYTASAAGMRYTPLLIYFLPAILGLAVIIIRLKQP